MKVSAHRLVESADLRIDPHYYELRERISPLFTAAAGWRGLEALGVVNIENGLNLGTNNYTREDEEPAAWYASVGSVSGYVLQVDNCTGLRAGGGGLSAAEIEANATTLDDVLLTRSGTPGIAWAPGAEPLIQEQDLWILPSGFMIKLRCDPTRLDPTYLSALLNHPVWRLWTSALAAGKRQRNLSQEHLRELRLPALELAQQQEVGELYGAALARIRAIGAQSGSLAPVCDTILRDTCGLEVEQAPSSIRTVERATLSDVAASRHLRIDFRHLRSDLRTAGASVASMASVPLGNLVATALKRAQPRILPVDDQLPPRVVATSSIQAGVVVEALTKQTDEGHLSQASSRQLAKGDLLVAMDGDGSIGKAAVFSAEYEALCDSHVAAYRLHRPELALAIACFVNSAIGQGYVQRHASGATGQIQLSPEDLLALPVPLRILDQHKAIALAYSSELASFQGGSSLVKREICAAGATTSQKLAAAGALRFTSSSIEEAFTSPDRLYLLLDALKPRMF